jgi:hypothetical protein
VFLFSLFIRFRFSILSNDKGYKDKIKIGKQSRLLGIQVSDSSFPGRNSYFTLLDENDKTAFLVGMSI